MIAQIAGAIYIAEKQKNDNTPPRIGKVGIKFDNISAGKLYPEIPVLLKYSWLKAEGPNEPSVQCQSTLL